MKTREAKQPAEVKHVHSRPIKAVVLELEDLLTRARKGDIIGVGYTVVTRRQSVQAGLAGTLAKDKWKAAGAFLHAAVRATEKHDPHE